MYFKNFVTNILIILILFFYNTVGFAQLSFGLSYGFSYLTKNSGNTDIIIHRFNHIQYSPPEKEMDNFAFLNGLGLHFILGNKAGFELNWINHHDKNFGEGIKAGTDTLYRHYLKIRNNTLGMGFFVRPAETFRFGCTMDIGSYKLLKRSGPKDDIKSIDWLPVYDKGVMSLGFTFFGELLFSNILSIRPYYYLDTRISSMKYNTSSSERKYFYNLSSIGVSTILLLSTKRK